MTFTSTPKTLAERLQWMADNLPGFREELDAVQEAKRRIASKSRSAAPARSEARTAAASGFLVASAPCDFCQAGEVSPPDSPTYGNPDKLGCVVHCTNDDVSKASFLPYGENVDTFCKPGDIICIDEAWRFWGTDCKLLAEHKIFFREHRHFVDPESKVSCDLVLMVQDIGDLHRTLKVVVEVTFKTTKIKTLGWDKTYRVEMWEGYKLTQKGRVSVENKRYDPVVFPLYSSYQGGAGKEMRVDDRQNILKSPKLWILALVVIVMFGLGVWGLVGFFSGSKFKDKKAGDAAPAQTVAATDVQQSTAKQDVSDLWRIVGSYQVGADSMVVIANESGTVRLEHPSAFQNAGHAMVGHVDGQRVMFWSGVPVQQSKGSQ